MKGNREGKEKGREREGEGKKRGEGREWKLREGEGRGQAPKYFALEPPLSAETQRSVCVNAPHAPCDE